VRLYVGGLIVLLCACAHKKKKWLFAVTEKGTKANANLYSLVENAKANNIEPSVYLSEKFTRLSSASCVEDILTFLPWNAAKKVR
jgi:transposase